MADFPQFDMPLTGFQRTIVETLNGLAWTWGYQEPRLAQHPYQRPTPGSANQYLTAEFADLGTLFLYDTEVGFEDFTFERPDYPHDSDQIRAVRAELEMRRSSRFKVR